MAQLPGGKHSVPGRRPDQVVLTEPQRRALAVLAAADNLDGTHRDRRPCRTSNRTSNTHPTQEMLTVHRMVAYQLEAAGLATFTNMVLETLELTKAGREVAREAGL